MERKLIGSELPLVERLRKMQGMGDYQFAALMDGVGPQAADEIERLKAQVEVAMRGYTEAVQQAQCQAVANREMNTLMSENNRLRGVLLLAHGRLLRADPNADITEIEAALLAPNAEVSDRDSGST